MTTVEVNKQAISKQEYKNYLQKSMSYQQYKQQMAQLSNGKIEMKLLYRDQNDELMNAYLTNLTRSIPRLVQLDEHLNVTGIWGPRPSLAQKLVKELKSNPVKAASYGNELHLWYAKDKQQSLEKEVAQLVYRAHLYCPDCLS